ncbi:MAG: hypothetical protein ABUK01_06705 [Leptospirales bacterium]
MQYPALRTYLAAISDTENINIPFFKSNSMQIFLNSRGKPYMSVGGFGAVFKFKDKNENQYALKVFTRDAKGRAQRYKALHDTLQITKFPFMVDFQYVQDGLKVGKEYFPVVVMEWGGGLALNSAIGEYLQENDSTKAPIFAGNLFSLTKTLQEWNMGHGDFQEGNLLVLSDGRIHLIDYDGMFVPALEGEKANEKGLADYQHPKRGATDFGSTIDNFSLLSVLFQLSIIDSTLWKEHSGDKRLILKEADYRAPSKSKIIKAGLASSNLHTVALANLLKKACKLNPLEIDAVKSISEDESIMNWLRMTEATAPETEYTSIISKVVSLTTDEVDAYEQDESAVIPVNENVNPEPERDVTENAGTWNVVTSFFFDDDDDDEAGESPESETGTQPGLFNKLKKSMIDLIYEDEGTGTYQYKNKEMDEEESKTAKTQPVVTPRVGAVAPAPTPAVSSPAPKKVVPVNKPEKEVKKPTISSGKKDGKTSPVPDWMKHRKRGK